MWTDKILSVSMYKLCTIFGHESYSTLRLISVVVELENFDNYFRAIVK